MATATVSPTVSLAEACHGDWQAVIVGAGPAGAATAIRLARVGMRVLLLDRGAMPRGKVCGCCLSPVAVRELERLGLSVPALGGVPLGRVQLAAGGRSATLDLPGGAVVSRESFDASLVREAIAAGSHWLPHTEVAAIAEHDNDGIAVHVRQETSSGDPQRLRARCGLVAAGLFDRVKIVGHEDALRRTASPPPGRRTAAASRIGLGAILAADFAELPDGELVMAVGRRGYCGLVRLEDRRIDLAAAVDRSALSGGRGPAQLVREILAEALGALPLLRHPLQLDTAAFRATPPLTHESPLIAGTVGRIFRIGDAAGYVEPFTGEGIGWALTTARLVAESLCRNSAAGAKHPWPAAAVAADYAAAYRRALGGHHARCRRVARSLRMPTVVAAAINAARLAPWAVSRFVPAVTGGGLFGSHHP